MRDLGALDSGWYLRAVLLLPFQVSVLGTPSPPVTPTNLLYNVVSTPGRCTVTGGRDRPAGGWALVLIAGTVPGVITGSVIRVELLPGPRAFDLVVAAVLLRLGIWLVLTRCTSPDAGYTRDDLAWRARMRLRGSVVLYDRRAVRRPSPRVR